MSGFLNHLSRFMAGQEGLSQLVNELQAAVVEEPDRVEEYTRIIRTAEIEEKFAAPEIATQLRTALTEVQPDPAACAPTQPNGSAEADQPTEALTRPSVGAEDPPAVTAPSGRVGYTGTGRTEARPMAPGDSQASGLTPVSQWTDVESGGRTVDDLDVGSVLKDRFYLTAVVAAGGMGVVYKARDRRKEEALDQDPFVATKVLTGDFKSHPDALKALQREAKKAQQLAHPNVVTVYDFDRDGEIVFMTMEYLEGQPLQSIVKRVRGRGMALKEALPLIEGTILGLAYAHQRGIVHSDVKPGNIFVTHEDGVKVLDFGIARAAKGPNQKQPEDTAFDAGSLNALTPAYASPEMFARNDPDPRDDIYAVACIAYELLAGRHPFGRRPADEARERGLRPEPIKGLSPRQWRALRKSLSLDRASRTADIMELLDGLRGKRRLVMAVAAVGVLASAGGSAAVWYWYDTQLGLLEPENLPEPKPITDPEVAAQVDRLLNAAEVHQMVGRYVEPSGSSAYDAYRKVLELQPHNRDALAGLEAIAEHYADRAREALRGGEVAEAKRLITVALRARPRDRGLLALEQRIEKRL